MMYTVNFFDEATQDDAVVFTGTLDDCKMYVELFKDDGEDLYIMKPDGFTVI